MGRCEFAFMRHFLFSEWYRYYFKTALLQVGRIEKDYPFVDAHRAPCHEVAWSPFNDNVIASCSEDTTCKVSLQSFFVYIGTFPVCMH